MAISLSSASVTLTDAQIKALPTTGVTIIPAPGANCINVPVVAYFQLTATVTYTNVNGTSFGLFLVNDETGNYDMVTTFVHPNFLGNESSFAIVPLLAEIVGTRLFVPTYNGEFSNWVNKPTVVGASNAGDGNYLGGHAANTLTVSVLYVAYNVATGGYVNASTTPANVPAGVPYAVMVGGRR